MQKLKLISKVMMSVGCISFIGGILVSMKEIMEFGLYVGVAGIVAYAAYFLMTSTSFAGRKSISD